MFRRQQKLPQARPRLKRPCAAIQKTPKRTATSASPSSIKANWTPPRGISNGASHQPGRRRGENPAWKRCASPARQRFSTLMDRVIVSAVVMEIRMAGLLGGDRGWFFADSFPAHSISQSKLAVIGAVAATTVLGAKVWQLGASTGLDSKTEFKMFPQ